MNDEIDIVHIGDLDDIDVGSVENFEHEEIDYAIFHLESGFFATQGHCNCEEQAFLSEASIEGEEFTAPLVGTFYQSAKPGTPPFVKEGDKITKGQIICIIEAMKIFNEIEAEHSGIVMKILVQDGTPVEYGQPLMIINAS